MKNEVVESHEDHVKGFYLSLDGFCENCGDFSPDIQKKRIQWLNGIEKFHTEIMCANREKCRKMCQWHEKRMMENAGTGNGKGEA